MIRFTLLTLAFLGLALNGFAQTTSDQIASIIEVQQYNRAIHIMAMLLIGFGFLMVFVKKIWSLSYYSYFPFG